MLYLVLDKLLHGVICFPDEALAVVMVVRLVSRRSMRMTHVRDGHASSKVVETGVLPLPPGLGGIFVSKVGPAGPLLLKQNQPLVEMQKMDAAFGVILFFFLGELVRLEILVV